MKAGLVGFGQSGKTTFFNSLTGQSAQTGGGRGDKANLGVIKVPDTRIDRLSGIFKPKRTVYAEVLFVDVPGSRGKGGGFDSATVTALREADALVLVLRGFAGFDGLPPDPVRELADFESELILNDLVMVERRLERLKKEAGHDREKVVLDKLNAALQAEIPLRRVDLAPEEEREVTSFAFLSRRPLLVVLNAAESEVAAGVPAELEAAAADRQLGVMIACASIEAEVASLVPEEQREFLADLGVAEPAAARLIQRAYALLDYISFFTVGEDEVRAWPVRRGSKAPRAAGRVHSDIERGFIRAEVMRYDEFVQVGSEARMKDLGKLRIEGKEYVVQDGDIVHFRFNV
ncbi:MAG: redox-regulated ATPase YchF [Polyangiaceae bacterium]|nr:redox-regulated ATPase YchF [Polyangiaceae bacterium]